MLHVFFICCVVNQLQEDKNSMKLWFRKKLESQDENARILDKTTKWTLQKIVKHIYFHPPFKITLGCHVFLRKTQL